MTLDIKYPLPQLYCPPSNNDKEFDAFLEPLNLPKKNLELLYAIKEHSPFLYQNLRRDKEFAQDLFSSDLDILFNNLIDTLKEQTNDETDTPKIMSTLRKTKRKISTLIAIADLSNHWRLEKITESLSIFADLSLQIALCHLLKRYASQNMINLPDVNDPEKNCGYLIIAMGKHGGFELNYSSDIDFIILFDPNVFPVSKEGKEQIYATRIARDLIKILDDRTPDGYVFRTDLRLRPDPNSMPLAVSIHTAKNYYETVGQNWERAAMIKARPIAGDKKLAKTIEKIALKWMWDRTLDSDTIHDIHSIKRQINAYHVASTDDSLTSFNVKLGNGGIREIEFFLQTQQLILGIDNVKLRSSQTLPALKILEKYGHISKKAQKDLTNAYIYLRNVEHRLQMIDDRQTHSLPDTKEGIEKFSCFMGYNQSSQFLQDLTHHLSNVSLHYSSLFQDAPSLSNAGNLVFTGFDDDPETLKTLKRMGFSETSRIAGLVRGWHHGKYPATHSTRSRQILTELIPSLLESFGKTAHPDEAFINFDHFISTLAEGIPIFTLFHENPDSLNFTAEILGTAPRMSIHLSQNPEILNMLLSRSSLMELPNKLELKKNLKEHIQDSKEYNETLRLIRIWVQDKKFQAGLHIIKHLSTIHKCSKFLSLVAEISVLETYKQVKRDFESKHGRIKNGRYALIALGRLGSQQISFASDLDLVALYHVTSDEKTENNNSLSKMPAPQYYTKLTQQLISAISAATPEGRLYEVDMRLRPAGDASPIVITLDRFVSYHQNDAWTWEHMTLIRARPIAGNKNLREDIKKYVYDIICQNRSPDTLLSDVHDMHKKLTNTFSSTDIWDMKHRSGGLMDIMFIVQYLILKHAHSYPDIICRDIETGTHKLQEHGLISDKTAQDLIKMAQLAKKIQAFTRLCEHIPFVPEQTSDAFKKVLTQIALGEKTIHNFDYLTKKLNKYADNVVEHYQNILSTPAQRIAHSKK